jgi:hypothetical protein
MQLRGKLLAGGLALSRSSSFIRSTIEVRQLSFCLFCGESIQHGGDIDRAPPSDLGALRCRPSRVVVPDCEGDAVGLAGLDGAELDGAEVEERLMPTGRKSLT